MPSLLRLASGTVFFVTIAQNGAKPRGASFVVPSGQGGFGRAALDWIGGKEGVMRLSGQDIVCISVMDWDHPFQSSRHHLMRQLAERNRVLFVDASCNPIEAIKGLREPRFRTKFKSWLHIGRNPRPVAGGLDAWTPPPTLPMGKIRSETLFEPVYQMNQWVLGSQLRALCRRLGMLDPILWISFDVLSSEGTIGRLNERLVVYHCTDEIGALPGASAHASRIEERLLRRADLVFTSSPALQESKSRHATNCLMVPNGVDFELFNRAVHPEVEVPADLARLPRPVVGFIGNIEDRFDMGLWRHLAFARPEWSFVAIGPIAECHRESAAQLAELPNVHFLGLRPRSALPGYLKGISVATIPFVKSEQTRNIYPLKVNEYFAAGKPVVMSDFAPLADVDGLPWVATNAASFLEGLDRAIATPSVRATVSRIQRAREHSWDARCQAMEAAILAQLAERSSPQRIPLLAERRIRKTF